MNYEEERQLIASGVSVIGADEVGRGALAGPIVACACLINQEFINMWNKSLAAAQARNEIIVIQDSKKMSKIQRAHSAIWLEQNLPMFEIVSINAKDIDVRGIQKANGEVLEKSLTQVSQKFHNSPDDDSHKVQMFIDHFPLKEIGGMSVQPITKGESKSLAIAAASIVAKVYRDTLMAEYASEYPQFKWESNAGYGTAAHRKAIEQYGATPHHRMTFLGKILGSTL